MKKKRPNTKEKSITNLLEKLIQSKWVIFFKSNYGDLIDCAGPLFFFATSKSLIFIVFYWFFFFFQFPLAMFFSSSFFQMAACALSSSFKRMIRKISKDFLSSARSCWKECILYGGNLFRLNPPRTGFFSFFFCDLTEYLQLKVDDWNAPQSPWQRHEGSFQ